MCGIFCEICNTNSGLLKDINVLQRIKNRGPDCTQYLELNIGNGENIFFCGSVLWMQGPCLTPQPVDNLQSVLLYNGDIFDETWDTDISDTQLIMTRLSNSNDENKIINELKSLKGPFAIIYYDKITRNMYFTRDRIGRSTLLFYQNDNSIIISNVLGRTYDCVEIPANHIQILNLDTKKLKLIPWNERFDAAEEIYLNDWIEHLRKQQGVPDDEFQFNCEEVMLNEEDSVVTYISTIAKSTNCKLTILEKVFEYPIIKETVLKLTELLQNSIKLRLKRQPNKCKECVKMNKTNICNHCTVGVLFSGGLDCTILALLADKYLSKEQSIDLINVSFKKDEKASYDIPDRLTGRQSLNELKKLCPTRKWVFREVNVPKEEIDRYQEGNIGDLVYPRQTILDESLGTALWFASKGQDSQGASTSRVLLLGSGADELFGGYIRHRNALKRTGWQGLNKELILDWKRISFRNLARDNRVICDHGRQPRMPYLDEDFTDYVLQLKPWLRCFPTEDLDVGIGDKLMLRLVAFHLGLKDAVVLPKRALQFGSRIANKKEKGSDLSKTFMKIL